MTGSKSVWIQEQEMLLLPDKACYWKATQTLLLSDLHLGKIAHFRKHGIPLPLKLAENELERLSLLIAQTKAERLMVLGDMFHSSDNAEVFLFELWRAHFTGLQILLIEGNHDILKEERYRELAIECHPVWKENHILFAHHPPQTAEAEAYGMYGHLHPGVTLRGLAKQSLRLPCFWAGSRYALLPAFGAFTGFSSPPKDPHAKIFLFGPGEVIEWNPAQ